MNYVNKHSIGLAITALLLSSVNASAANTKVASLPLSAERIGLQLQQYQAQGAGPFSADAGQVLWLQQSEDRSCASCHTAKVTDPGMHQNTRKPIEAMAPSLTSNRLTDAAKIEKWFNRNCNWTFKRECTPQEKGDVLLWLSLQ
ncbi:MULTISPECIES: DUF1924 domain-containing protein [Shewanella]|uniref:DUF1924 domain-containing protein n=1 Tax=Shewanella TaxID=22 RepID=UPI00193D9ACA|nr:MULTISPECIES: DUF1924 domain-containing protein [Shewanella]MCR4534594.1 DUF1924 domain-containing protein [Shewanella xiamenensis]MDI5875723.1 DUF1924 domain-containing protein [Shewanella xiamenensis]MDL3987069.1 DUF1924 domain-containing protein [Shewanella xiamenensis]QRK79814.1 DUF1924 domain-containing protein [Shewanella sp. LZH-2]